jgi:hypothetical protein
MSTDQKSGSPSKSATPAKPTEMPADVLEFIQAINDYKRLNSRPFPNWSEVLDVVKALGYGKDPE